MIGVDAVTANDGPLNEFYGCGRTEQLINRRLVSRCLREMIGTGAGGL